MLIRKFDRAQLESEPHNVLFKDLYPWDQIEETPFGASLAVVEPGGQTMIHSHHPCETFFICQGQGTMTCNDLSSPVSSGDVIYLPPQSVHKIQNDSDTDSLMFLSVFWDAPENEEATPPVVTSRLIWPSPPTPNGPLHLGHLSGPYLLADVLKRYYRQRGLTANWLLVSDDHQSYVSMRAQFDETTAEQAATHYSAQMLALMKSLEASPDVVINPSQNADYRQAVQAALTQLYRDGFVSNRSGTCWHCADCDRYLYDGLAAGTCPHCDTSCRGYLCETCCQPNLPTTLRDVHCLHCETPAQMKEIPQLVFSLAPFAQALAAYHQQLRLSPRLRALASRFLSLRPAEVVVSHPSDWGIPIEMDGFEGQVLSPWFELSLAGPLLTAGHEVIHCFGADNAFLYLMQDPAVRLALHPQRPLPTALHSNEYLMLDEQKMSTSRGHTLDGAQLLAQLPADLMRLYLAGVRPENSDTRCNIENMQQFLALRVVGPWHNWLEALGRSLTTEAGSKAPDPVNWGAEQQDFFGQLNGLLSRGQRAYEVGSLQEVARTLHEVVDQSTAFSLSQQPLAGVPELLAERSTSLALELAAARLLAQLSAPLMPKFATQLWKHLGYRNTLEQQGWPQQVEFVPGGQRILAAAGLSSRRYFPS
ncbi:class I tRNA ligase family protein [bacterium]|nr:class I tRNA ligase family protein [bacterium]